MTTHNLYRDYFNIDPKYYAAVTADAGIGAYWGLTDNQTWADAYDSLVKDIKSSTDPAERAHMSAVAEKILMSTGGVAPLYYYTNPYMLKPNVKNVIMLSTGDVIWNYAEITPAG